MKKMSCFCASNSSGDSVYSGYFRWRMGLPLPPIPQEEESHVLKNTNKEIFNEIIGVKHANDFTIEECDADNTPRRFRRRKNQEPTANTTEVLFVPKDNLKGFRENPMYINTSKTMFNLNEEISLPNFSSFIPIKDEIFVPSQSESFNNGFSVNDSNLKTNYNIDLPVGSISSFLVNKFLSNIQEYSENVPDEKIDEDSDDKSLNNNPVPNKALENIIINESKEPPAIPPHRKPSTIIEESESDNDTVRSVLDLQEKENIELIDSDNKTSQSTMTSTMTSIPIFSIKHGDIDKILSESVAEYDYAYNKSWSKGVEFNLSMNLSGDKKCKRIKTSHHSRECKKEKNETVIDTIVEDEINQGVDQINNQVLETLNVSIDSFTDCTDDSMPVHSFPETSPIPFLKLSSIEADALKPSPTTVSRNSQVSSSFAESETDSRNEPWDVIHGRFYKDVIATRFIDPSIINNNKPSLIKMPSSEDSKGNSNNFARNRTINSNSELKLQKESLKRVHININPKTPLEKQPWYHFYLTRSKAESMLANHPDGSFLVRRSESNKNAYSLTIKHKGIFLHMKITKNNKGFVLGEYSQPYQSIPHMLYHYCLTMVPVKGADAASLRFAVTKDQI